MAAKAFERVRLESALRNALIQDQFVIHFQPQMDLHTLTKLKIDQSFIKDISFDPYDQVITRTIIALGKNLGLTTIAEGVEYEDQKNFLTAEGCDAAQGFYYSPPLPEREFLAFVKTRER